jgi:competence protein ComEC
MKRPLLPILLVYAAGITAGVASPPPGFRLIFAFAVSFILQVVSTFLHRKVIALVSLLVSLFLLSWLSVAVDRHAIPESNDISRFASDEILDLEGLIVETPRVFPERAELTVKTTKIFEGMKILPIQGKILLSVKHYTSLPEYGSIVRFKTKLKTPRNFNNPGGFDYKRYLHRKGIRVRGNVDGPDVVVIRSGCGNPIKQLLERFRSDLRTEVRKNAESPKAEILQAMILGEQSEIPREITDRFSRTGTTHIIAISGFNIGIIAAFSFFIAHFFMRRSEYLLLKFNMVKVSALAALAPVILFTFISGLIPSVVRAALMAIVCLFALTIGRDRDPLNILALVAVVILTLSPLSLFDVSFQLSFAAVASMLLIVPRFSPLLSGDDAVLKNSKIPRWIRKLTKGVLIFMIVTVSAGIGTAPIIIYYFNMFSTITLLANMLIVPIMGYLVIILGMAIILTTLICNFLTGTLVSIASWLIGVCIIIVEYLSRLPYAYVHITTPTLAEVGFYYVILLLGMKLFDLTIGEKGKAQTWSIYLFRRGLSTSLCLIFLFLIGYHLILYQRDRHPESLSVTYLDVGHGNSALVRFPNGMKFIIDGGGFYDGSFDIGRYVLAPLLWHERIDSIDTVVLSHPHPDHLGGLLFLLKNFHVREVWTNGEASDSADYLELIKIISEKRIRHCVMNQSYHNLSVGESTVQLMNPWRLVSGDADPDANDRSLVLRIVFGDTTFLFPGDISELSERALSESGFPLKSEALLAPHHGSRFSNTPDFIKAVQPEHVIFSSGSGLEYCLPHPDVLERYQSVGCKIYRTNSIGAVTLKSDGRVISATSFISP